jgi:hypothetical protein
MLGEVRASVVARRGNQVFDVLLLGHNTTYAILQAKVLELKVDNSGGDGEDVSLWRTV